MSFIKYLFYSLLFLVLFGACTMQKRKYTKGYYVENRKHDNRKIDNNQCVMVAQEANQLINMEPGRKQRNYNETVWVFENACDTVYLKSGAKMVVKVSGITKEKTYYSLCEGSDKTEFNLETNKLKRVCFASGKIDSLLAVTEPVTTVEPKQNTGTTVKNNKPVGTGCDTIYTREGKKILCKVNGVYFDKTLYVLCNSDNQAEWDVETRTLRRICYGNGNVDSLKNIPASKAPMHTYEPKQNEGFGYQRTAELNRAARMANNAMIWAIVSAFFPYVGLVAFILAAIARKRLQGKKGYERYYKKANIIFWIFAILYGIVLVAIFAALLILMI